MKSIPRTSVKSSSISEIGYDEDKKTLVVKFGNGGLYAYKDVPSGVYADLRDAESAGKHLMANIRGKYEHTKL
jgi:hypothetical protein